jgi:hypothetical protein
LAIFDNIPGWKVFSAGIGLAALALVGFFVWKFWFATPEDLKELQEQAATHALEQLAETYKKKVVEQGEQRVIVMPVRNDTSNAQIREMLISRLNKVDGVKATKPADPNLEERAGAIVRSLIDKEEEQPDPAEVFAESAEADEVLTVSVAKLWSGADSGICQLDIYRIVRDDSQERTPRILESVRIKGLSGTAVVETEPDMEGDGFWATLGGFLWRMLVVLAAAVAMPFLFWPAAKFAFSRDSNAMNAGLLVLMTVLDVLILFLLDGMFSFTITAVVCAGLLLPAALLYNFRMLNWIEEQ